MLTQTREASPAAPGGAGPSLAIQLLGGFWVAVGGQPLPDTAWRRRRAAGLLKLLALAPGHSMARDEVLEQLWPDLALEAAANNLRYTAHALRAALRAPSAAPAELVRLRGERVSLGAGGVVQVDVAAFEAAAAAARRSGDPAAYEAALALYGGELLPEDRYEDWAAAPREALRETYLALLADLARLREARGEHAAAIAALERLAAAEPAREEAHAGLMRLYALTGQRGRALRQWARLEAALRDELDVAPDPASRQLHLDILAGRFLPAGARPGGNQPAAPVAPPAPAPRHNLPAPLTSFIGRAWELAETGRLLGTTRLLTLTGAGGSGKTRLALEVARALPADYPDGIWLVELAALGDPALVPEAVAAALGVRETSGRSLTEVLIERLRSATALLVLDNCEHLGDACAALAAVLLAACPGLRVLATSRAALWLPGEVTWHVPALTLPDPTVPPLAAIGASEAAQLFVDRARWRRPAFAVTPENAAAVAAICRRLDGIPLALELAAARLAVLPVAELARRLDDALGVLTEGSRVAPPRHRTLRATFDWSYALLAEPARVLLRRLAVFAGGGTLAAVEAVCADDALPATQLLDALAALVDHSLVQVEDDTDGARYRLLETTRQYAAAQLVASGEAAAIEDRHAAFCLALAEEAAPALAGPGALAWLARLETEHGNLRAALAWARARGETGLRLRLAGALWRFWVVCHPGEGRGWLAGALEAGEAVPAPVRAWALHADGMLAEYHSEYERVARVATEALRLCRALGDTRGIGIAQLGLALVAFRQGDWARAEALLADSLARARAAGDRWGVAQILGGQGRVALHRGDLDRAATLLAESAALFRELEDPLLLAEVLTDLGLAALQRRDQVGARRALGEGLRLFWAAHGRGRVAECLEGLAGVAALGQAEPAARLWGAAETLRAALGAPPGRVDPTLQAAHVAAARAWLGEAAFAAAWAAGRAMSLEEAVATALAVAEAFTVPSASAAVTALSPRECDVAALVAEGRTNAQIAAALGLATRTVDTHVARLLKKLGVASRAEVAARLPREHPTPLAAP